MRDLVCLHAGTSGPSTWDQFVPEFEAMGYRVHRPTLLGHGSAPRRRPYRLDDFRDQVLRELRGLDRVTFVGNSLGAFVASAVAVAEPDRVERMVLEELPVPPRDAQDRAPTVRPMPPLALLAAGWLTRRRCDPRLLRDVIADLRRPQPEWWAGLSTIQSPTMLLAGGARSHLDQSRFGLLTNLMPSATVTTIEAGHRIHTQAPDRWLATVRTFLAFKGA
ncbi:alpha/beta fold hydrolase [Kribbella speibonae]|uniref:Alpha/beta fold hydrolase n=1 Tax=Kribbella speibonae TaxID=1572660 RepID=A0A4V6N488_9ACTN|nr:alpha/beta hydrolase [Kribbella speibonae]TCC26470.1 alpha/beta fold hydrolase [Kribbella speibonae]TCC38572.1 alpha/beta fold hydrolase [Kribbella speibonae]